ncbi:MAG: TfoX/Sxy family protein [Chloroflexi bacterium]|nr:TfoX/Sxy family protein [Chloroflexota bacterium]
MPYNEALADRIRIAFAQRQGVTERKMFGGIAFMVDGKMAVGVQKDDLMLRVSGEEFERALARPHVRPMDFTGRPMVGFLYVAPGGCQADADLRMWVDMAVSYAQALPAKKTTKERKAQAS